MGCYHAQLLVLNPLFEGYDIFCHIPYLLNGAATLDVEGSQNILCLRTDSSLVGDVVGNSPHLFPVELLGIYEHAVIEVCLVDIEVHHARIWAANLCDVGIAEAAAHLCSTAPVLYLCLNTRVTTFYYTGNDSRALAGTIQVGNHLTNSAAGIEVAQPGGNIGLGIVGSQFLLQIHNDDGHVEIANGRQHIIRGTVGQHLENDKIDISCSELITGSHRLLLGGHHATIDNLNGVWQRLLERLILSLEVWYELWELWQVCLKGNAEYTYLCFGFY